VFRALAVVVAQLAFEALHDPIERVLHVGSLRVGAERLPGNAERSLQSSVTLRAMALGDHLDLDALDPSLEPCELLQLVEREIVQPVLDDNAAGLHDQIHAAPSGLVDAPAVRSLSAAGAERLSSG
jgi:hypothetical protein